tara:strand:+ start:1541 stop:1855 length:315 start_codon:yes stop_codon:yes gene_type:complete
MRKSPDYKFAWVWKEDMDSSKALNFTIIPDCSSYEQAQQKALEYMLDVWVSNYSSFEELKNDAFMYTHLCFDDGCEHHSIPYNFAYPNRPDRKTDYWRKPSRDY